MREERPLITCLPDTTAIVTSIAGIDGAGKSTLVKHLLREAARPMRFQHFPNYETECGQLISELLSGRVALGQTWAQEPFVDPVCDGKDTATAMALQSLMITNRIETLPMIEKWVSDGNDVILDRYSACGLAYGEADGLDPAWLRTIHTVLPHPDIHILLDIPVDVSFERRPVRDNAYEASRDRLEAVRTNYLRLWENMPSIKALSWQGTPVRWVKVDGTLPPELIANAVRHLIEKTREEAAQELYDASITGL